MDFLRVTTTTRFAPVGFCIYCGSTGSLSDEHVIPLALGGNLVLPESTCSACSDITSAFEGKVLRGFMHSARLAGDFPTRRRKERPVTRTVTLLEGESARYVSLPRPDTPAFLYLPTLTEPAVFSGAPYSTGVNMVAVETLLFGPDPILLIRAQGATGIRQTDDLDLTPFVRMLAKIGYSYIVGVLGPFPLSEVTVLPFICGKSGESSRWVGSHRFVSGAEACGALHVLTHTFYRRDTAPNDSLLVARVKLFANTGATGYEVVVRRLP